MLLAVPKPKPKPKAAEPGLVQTAFRLPSDLLEALDAWVEELNECRGWPKVTRSDVLRSLLERGLRERPEMK